MNLAERLNWMADHGWTLSVGWESDMKRWECSWITGGVHYTASDSTLNGAVSRVLLKATSASEYLK